MNEHLRLAILRYMAGWYVKREDIEKARLGAIIRKHRGGLPVEGSPASCADCGRINKGDTWNPF